MKIEKYKTELLILKDLYIQLSILNKNGVIFSPHTEGFNLLDTHIQSIILEMNKNNITGFISLIKDFFIHNDFNNNTNLWSFYGCKVSHLRKLLTLMPKYIKTLKNN